MRKILYAFGFLSILPLPAQSSGAVDEKTLGESAAFFPLVGLVQGLLAAVALFLLEGVYSPGVTAGLMVAGFVIFSGGLHIDGLSDTFDALASRAKREKKLAVMKDGSAGPIGAASVVLVLVLKILLLQSVFERGGGYPYFCLFLLPVIGKWSMVCALYHGRSAKDEGLGSIFINNTGGRQIAVATALSAVILGPMVLLIWTSAGAGLAMSAVTLATVYFGGSLFRLFLQRRFDGLTGDNLGAVNEISELLFLFALLPFLWG
jgi:adenosylcobinamide-GDP ribazoletransferase